MANYYEDNEDIKYYVEKWVPWEPLVRLTEYEYGAEDGFSSAKEALEFYQDILLLVGKFAANEIAPWTHEIDESEVSLEGGDVKVPEPLETIFESIKELDLHGMCVPRELGGMNCPLLIYYLNSELFSRAETAVMAHHGFHGGIAMAMLMYSLVEGSTEFQRDPPRVTKTRFEKEIAEIISGQSWGSMDITEPDAGSDMAALRCTGEQDENGQWYVSGQKIFITSGHGKYHFVIARTEKKNAGSNGDDAFVGLKGLSLFLVPIYKETSSGKKEWLAEIDRVEEKLGHHGSVTVSLNFDRTPAHLVGERGDGFKQMLLLMNNARISVGFESLGLCEAAYRLAKEYAQERASMGKTIDRHEMIADYLEEMETDIQSIRALAVYCAYHEEMAQKWRIKMIAFSERDGSEYEQAKKEHLRCQRLSRAATPLLKYYAAEKAVETAQRAIQIHGGVGYTKEYGAEKLLRDAMVFPIYEGTSQIQALMAMKDAMMDLLRRPKPFLKNVLRAKATAMTSRDPLERRVAKIQSMCLSALQNLVLRVALGKVKGLKQTPASSWIDEFKNNWDPKRDFAPAMLHAERLTQLLTFKSIAEILLEQSQRHTERREVLIRFLERAEPKTEYLHRLITGTGERLIAKLEDTVE